MFQTTWRNRSRDIANIFNPPFCCTILTSSIFYYQKKFPLGMIFPLTYLVLPLVIHKQTRNCLPVTIKTSLPMWVEKNSNLLFQLNDHVNDLKPFLMESILFGFHYNWLKVNNGFVKISLTDNKVKSFDSKLKGEVHECFLKSKFLGRWFSNSGNPETILGLFGVKQ
jgi:hypothetical protein